MLVSYICDGLIDQGVYIEEGETGSTVPVGYKCSRPASYEASDGRLVCQHCDKLLAQKSPRIEFRQPWGKAMQDKAYQSVLDGLRKAKG